MRCKKTGASYQVGRLIEYASFEPSRRGASVARRPARHSARDARRNSIAPALARSA